MLVIIFFANSIEFKGLNMNNLTEVFYENCLEKIRVVSSCYRVLGLGCFLLAADTMFGAGTDIGSDFCKDCAVIFVGVLICIVGFEFNH